MPAGPAAPHTLGDQGPTAPTTTPDREHRSRAWLALLLLAAGHAALRLAMNHEFEGAPWDELLDFSAAKPFGLRVLVPLLAWPLHSLLRVPTLWVFGLFELLATAALVLAAAAALRPFVAPRWAAALGVLLVLLLPIAFLLQHRWPIFYPYDTPAMAFTAGGVALLLHRRWRAAACLGFLAALNRESAILLPACALALHLSLRTSQPVPADLSLQPSQPVPPDLSLQPSQPVPPDLSLQPPQPLQLQPSPLRQLLPPVLALLAAVLAARGLVSLALRDNPGAPMQLLVDGTPRLLANLAWLEEPAHWLRLPAYLGYLPLAWPLLRAWMPAPLRRLGWVAAAYLGALMFVANIDEPRVYGEAIVLLFLPTAVALARWLRGDPPAV
ncbi:MAG: hypothetical protein IPO88_05460 [Nannocystis sp.]|uniref:hypothetical protein n=1 Tax=Nannocystis sp. TaxID=1962667 RepID=UPI0024248EBC|nr:hypothetical protein [Nannocystis sp.]MBK9752949.1 hypothetical protein [Nannocystis sp.]